MSRWLAIVVVLAAGCKDKSARSSSNDLSPTSPSPHRACVADGLGPLRQASDHFNDSCLDTGVCQIACQDGSPDACMAHAYAVQERDRESDASTAWFARACKLGAPTGCTNVGAAMWIKNQPASPADQQCAKRLFELACGAREPFGCGMLGRMLATEAETPEQQAAARKQLETACSTFGAMSCRMYALHLESGDLGPPEPAAVRTLMLRACTTGDEEACGHDMAAETFR